MGVSETENAEKIFCAFQKIFCLALFQNILPRVCAINDFFSPVLGEIAAQKRHIATKRRQGNVILLPTLGNPEPTARTQRVVHPQQYITFVHQSVS